jgi:hypothetical protein
MKKRNKELADVQAKDLVIFKSGTWNGETFTDSDLDNMAASFNKDEPIPFIIGHSSDYKGRTRIPAFGRITGGLKRIGSDLIAVGVSFNDKLANWIKEGFYNQRSIELTRDNKRVLAVGMLGATPPAVKGMPAMDDSLNEIALEFSDVEDAKCIEFSALDEVEKLAGDDTFKTISECCGRFIEDVEKMIANNEKPDRIMQEVWELQSDLVEALSLHASFIKKIEQIEEKQEYAHVSGWKEFVDKIKSIFNKRKELNEMDAQERKEYQEKIAELSAQVAANDEKEKAEAEAKAKAEADLKAAEALAEAERILAEAKVKEEAEVNEVKSFCEATIKEGRMTPAMRAVDEPIMLKLAKTDADALVSFQQKYTVQAVPLGIVKEVDVPQLNDNRSQVIQDAEKYVKAHPTEFADLTAADAVNRAFYLHRMGKIKFENKH